MKRKCPQVVMSFILCLSACTVVLGEELRQWKTAWGSIQQSPTGDGQFECDVRLLPADGVLAMPRPFPHVVWCDDGGGAGKVDLKFNQDASELALVLRDADVRRIRLHSAEKTQQFDDGRIVFNAIDAQVVGDRAKLEEHPGNYRIGFWTNAEDYVRWDYKATRWGMYRVLLTYSTASPDGSEVQVAIGEAEVTGKLRSTGSWYRYTTIDLGKLYLATSGPHQLNVKCTKKVGGAVMNLKAVLLMPACEGKNPAQADDGAVTLHARDATVHGTMLRWEPAQKKRTLGYWVREQDQASWTFTVKQAGKFDVEVLQGCGQGQGGSKMIFVSGEANIPWEVEETGHFQNFKPRIVGRLEISAAGEHRLRVRPVKIAKSAACDIRQVRLIPVKEE